MIEKKYNYIENNPNYPAGSIVYLTTKNNEFENGILTGLIKEEKINKKLLIQCIFIDKKENQDNEHIARSYWIPSEYISFKPLSIQRKRK